MSYLAGPVFYDANSKAVASIPCGQPYTFDVPGYQNVWLEQTLNGVRSYSGSLALPMPSYIADCVAQVGTYVNNAYELTPSGTKGAFIGASSFRVMPGVLAEGVIPTEGAGGKQVGFNTGSMVIIGAVGLAALFFMRKR